MEQSSNYLPDKQGAVPDPERRPILLRAYAEAEVYQHRSDRKIEPSEWVLVFDTETRTDETQGLRFGTFQLWRGARRELIGVFYDPDATTAAEQKVLRDEAGAQGYRLFLLADFIEQVFLGAAYKARATVVGFNLPFDLSRLAQKWRRAKRVTRHNRRKGTVTIDQSMVGGFTFTLQERDDRPNLRIKHLSRRSSFINFAAAADDVAMRAKRNLGARVERERGFFLDLKTLAAALTSTSYSLDGLADALGVARKIPFDDFERPIDAQFLRYALTDTEVTRQCYLALTSQYAQHGLTKTLPHRIYSEASLGKAYLREMNIRPWREVQPDFDPKIVGVIMSSYFGGRSEVHRRREIVPTLYCDFASMYPTVCTLMGLWRFNVATGVTSKDATSDAQAFLDAVTVATLQDPSVWQRLPVLVRVQPCADIFPVRARYGEEPMATIGLNYLSADEPLWFTLADCIASKLLTGRPPTVVEAIAFTPKEVQEELCAVRISGNADYDIHPASDDFYKRVIDLRRSIKARIKTAQKAGAPLQHIARLDSEQLALKILANATSYGIFIELNVEDADDKRISIDVCTSSGKRGATSSKREKPGTYFHPLLGTLITGAARLMLAITERLLIDRGLDWAFCDTDSMAFAAPSNMALDEFTRRVQSVCAWFEPLNPYEERGSILEIEDQNFSSAPNGERTIEPLFCAAISSKRYALFNVGEAGVTIRKASAHGLGHLLRPYDDDAGGGVRESGVLLWQEDLWKAIIRSLQSENPMHLPVDWRPELGRPAASQYSATTPQRLDWFKSHNNGRQWAEKVRPFNFMLEFYGKRPDEIARQNPSLLDNMFRTKPHPIAPYTRDISRALSKVWDRKTERHVPVHWLRTYVEALRGYHWHPETKFLKGAAMSSGPTNRRHIFVHTVEDIGKEADKWDDEEPLTADDAFTVSYGSAEVDAARMIEVISSVKKSQLAVAARVSHHTIPKAASDAVRLPKGILQKLYSCALRFRLEEEKIVEEDRKIRESLRTQIHAEGLTAVARKLGIDASNLAHVMAGRRAISKKLRSQL